MILAVVVAGAIAGCTHLLPRTSDKLPSPFASFEEARAALDRVVVHQTGTEELRRLGFDIADTNVERVPYPQWTGRLLQAHLTVDRLDPGLQQCLSSLRPCGAFVFRFSDIQRHRTGSFALDFLNFRRVTETNGWRFEAWVLVRDDRVLFFNYGGEPLVSAMERRVNPLGPLQSLGEAVAAKVSR